MKNKRYLAILFIVVIAIVCMCPNVYAKEHIDVKPISIGLEDNSVPNSDLRGDVNLDGIVSTRDQVLMKKLLKALNI